MLSRDLNGFQAAHFMYAAHSIVKLAPNSYWGDLPLNLQHQSAVWGNLFDQAVDRLFAKSWSALKRQIIGSYMGATY